MTNTPAHAQLIAPPPLLYLAFLGLGLGGNGLLGWDLGGTTSLRLLAGGALLIFGATFARWAFTTLRRHDTPGSPRQASRELVDDGPFAFSRNPIYLAQNALYLGITLIADSPLPLVLFPILLGVMHVGVIQREEHYLHAVFGRPYADYCRRVRRWL